MTDKDGESLQYDRDDEIRCHCRDGFLPTLTCLCINRVSTVTAVCKKNKDLKKHPHDEKRIGEIVVDRHKRTFVFDGTIESQQRRHNCSKPQHPSTQTQDQTNHTQDDVCNRHTLHSNSVFSKKLAKKRRR